MGVVYILIAILIFGLLIATHELGHFLTAKLLGVQVNEFSVGMGPALWSREKGETLYSLRAFPIGGYCAMEGEDEESDNPRAFGRAAGWKDVYKRQVDIPVFRRMEDVVQNKSPIGPGAGGDSGAVVHRRGGGHGAAIGLTGGRGGGRRPGGRGRHVSAGGQTQLHGEGQQKGENFGKGEHTILPSFCMEPL